MTITGNHRNGDDDPDEVDDDNDHDDVLQVECHCKLP